jgi:antitoxin ParD1/3/4
LRVDQAQNEFFSNLLEALVKRKVDSGLYNSASEVVRDALRLMEERDRLEATKLDMLREEIQNGLKSGKPILGDEVLARLRKKVRGSATANVRQKRRA